MPKVVIKDNKFVFGLGKGPFNNPVEISDELLRKLKISGYTVIEVNDRHIVYETPNNEEKAEEVKEDPKEELHQEEESDESVEATATEEENKDEEHQEESNEEKTESSKESDNEKVEDDSDEEDFKSMKVDELKEILEERGIEFKANDTKKVLLSKLGVSE
ncbi:hypothetical protein FPHOBKDP_00107 [Listeria phage LPJP1]|nr:hypothetical protein FPHOBKDP_00107 [Listeria phage LPJP1]